MKLMVKWAFFLFIIIISSILFGVIGFILSIVGLSKFFEAQRSKPYTPSPDRKPSGPITRVPTEYYDEYRKYLSSAEWKTLRKQVIKRDNHRCVRCDYIGYLQVHHTSYDGIKSMSFSLDQLETVCNDCHKQIHQGKLPMKKD